MLDVTVFDRLDQARVLVVGDVMLDRYWHGDTSRISPEAPVPVVKVGRMEEKAGGAANVARAIAHLGGAVTLLGIVGDDDAGQALARLLGHERISTELVTRSDEPTISKLRVLSRGQQVVRLDFEESFSPEAAQQLRQAFEGHLEGFDHVVFSDYAKGSLRYVGEMIAAARRSGATVIVDPKADDLGLYRGADVVTPNLAEFVRVGGCVDSEDEIAASARGLLKGFGVGAMLLTRGAQGMSLIAADRKLDLPAEVHEVSDVTGAGDTVVATLAVMLSAGADLLEGARYANLAAGVAVTKLGAATVSSEELAETANRMLRRAGPRRDSNEQALQEIAFARRSGEKIVFTNGCFDILHVGHVHYLEQARELGGRLVVGLNTDDSVRRLKGPGRPVHGYDDRATVLRSLAAVDWVLPFGSPENDTPSELIREVRPDVLVKGGDYTVDTIVGADFVQSTGGEVVVLDYVEGRSTTGIIDRLRGDGPDEKGPHATSSPEESHPEAPPAGR